MATTAATQEQVAPVIRVGRRSRRPSGRWILPAFTALAIGYLLIPIVVMIIFSFNDYQGKFNFVWHGFTLNAWLHPLDWQGLPKAIQTSLTIAFLALVGVTAAETTQAVGALLLLGLLAAPAAAAHRLTDAPYRGIALSAGLAVLAMWAGLTVSYVVPATPPSFEPTTSA